MKKHLIAAAVAAAVAVPAAAQVTVSGRIDTGIFSVEGFGSAIDSTTSQMKVNQKSLTTNQIVFSASEDLGGGLKAHALLSTEFASDEPNATTLGSRGSVVGITGGFGKVEIGRLTGNFIDGLGVGGPTGNLSGGGGFGLAGFNTKPMNAISYQLPTMSGFTARVIKSYNAAGAENADKDDEQTEVMVAYASGPLSVELAQVNHKRVDPAAKTIAANGIALAAANANSDVTERGAMVKYNAGIAALTLRYFDQEFPAAIATNYDNSAWALGAAVPLGNGLTASVDYRTIDYNTGATNGFDTKRVSATLVKSLSKRTNVYAAFYDDSNDGRADTGGLGVGIRHSF
jgi:predicted porin